MLKWRSLRLTPGRLRHAGVGGRGALQTVGNADAEAVRGLMEKRIVANADAAIAELTSLALAGDVTVWTSSIR